MSTVAVHLLAATMIVIEPIWGRVLYQKMLKRIASGDLRAKVDAYRQIFVQQVAGVVALLCLCVFGGISTVRLGLGAPRSWWLSAGLGIALGGLFLWSGIRSQPKAHKIRAKLKGHGDALLPDTAEERRWFGTISISAGINEELLFRGFLFYYLSLWFPHINKLECVLITSLIFGMAHLYQGWKGVMTTGIAGLIMAGLYVLTGNLVVPVVAHATGDLRALLIFWHGPEEQSTAMEAA